MKNLEKLLNYEFKNKELLKNALVHTSYAHEFNLGASGSNERLEFLGDTILNMSVSEYLYLHNPVINEGDMTKIRSELICEDCLYRTGKKIGYDKFILLGKGEAKSGGNNRPSIVSDAFEAIVAAIFIDGGIENAKKFVIDNLKEEMEEAILSIGEKDHKTKLQELLQSKSTGKIEYAIVGESGPEHKKQYNAVVRFKGKILGQGIGNSKKEAEQNAAGKALGNLI